jgi:hypothetical protein
MFIEAIIVGLIIAYFRGGRLDNFNYLDIKGWYLIIIGLMFQLTPIFISGYTFLTYLQLFGIIMILMAVLVNIKLKGFWLIMLGGVLNLLAVLVHDFKMPVNLIFQMETRFNSFIDTIIEGNVINYTVFESTTWTGLLGKILATPNWYPFPKLLSVGDIFITVGLFFFIYGELKSRQYRRKSSMVQYSYKTRI